MIDNFRRLCPRGLDPLGQGHFRDLRDLVSSPHRQSLFLGVSWLTGSVAAPFA
jgi:hypothetical protein